MSRGADAAALDLDDLDALADVLVGLPEDERGALDAALVQRLFDRAVMAGEDRELLRHHHQLCQLLGYGLWDRMQLRVLADPFTTYRDDVALEALTAPRLREVFESRDPGLREQTELTWWGPEASEPVDVVTMLDWARAGHVSVVRSPQASLIYLELLMRRATRAGDVVLLLERDPFLAAEALAAARTSQGFDQLAYGGDARALAEALRPAGEAGLLDLAELRDAARDGLARGWGGGYRPWVAALVEQLER